MPKRKIQFDEQPIPSTKEAPEQPVATPEPPQEKEDSVEIYDPLVFKLAYLEERKAHLMNLQMLRMRIYDERLMQIKYERKTEMEKIEAEKIRIEESLSALRKELESKHNIKLEEFGYDDEVGKLTQLPKNVNEVQEKKEVDDGTA